MELTRTKINVLANFAGSSWNALLSIALVPLYIRILGIEAYGLIGLFAAIQAVSFFFDFGISTTANRELARRTSTQEDQDSGRSLFLTFEVLYCAIGLCLGVLLAIAGPQFLGRWVNAAALSQSTVRESIVLMGLGLLFQWPIALYSAGLFGLQQQGTANLLLIAIATIRNLGVLPVLWFWSPSIQAFLAWQAAVNLCHALALRQLLWHNLPAKHGEKTRIQIASIRPVWRFTAGTAILNLQGVVISQHDKIILSRLLSLETFGYYSLATAVTQNLGRLVSPVVTAFFPRFTQLIAQRDLAGLATLYRKGGRFVASLVFPVMALLAVFSPQILDAWTRDAALAERTAGLLSLLVVAAATNATMHLPSCLQMAQGRLAILLRVNTVAMLMVPCLTAGLGYLYGAYGAAASLLFYNAVQALVLPYLLHRTFLREETGPWYLRAFLLPLLASLLAALSCRWFLPDLGFAGMVAYLGLTAAVIATATVWATGDLAGILRDGLRYARNPRNSQPPL